MERTTRSQNPAPEASTASTDGRVLENEQPVGLGPPAESGFEVVPQNDLLFEPGEDDLQDKDPFFDPQAVSRSSGEASSSQGANGTAEPSAPRKSLILISSTPICRDETTGMTSMLVSCIACFADNLL